jgi:leucyl-tRNA synthetase
VQVNGKVRAKLPMAAGIGEARLKELVTADPQVREKIAGKEIVKVIAVPDKLVNIVVKG